MTGSFPKASSLFNKFLKLTLGSYLRFIFNLSFDTAEIKGLKPPYIVLANHSSFWDPFILSICIPEPVYFVTSDTYFRNPVLRVLLKMVGAIPKTKSVSDPTSIKNIISIVKIKGIIGIYPEGRRNWDGNTLPLVYSTAKLIKSLKLPVISVLSKGSCLSMPRWANNTRKGKLSLTCSMVLDPEGCSSLSTDEIYERITQSLAHDEYAFQRSAMVPYKGRRLAERLELFLFACPSCRSLTGMRSSGDEFSCSCCGYNVRYDLYGFFTSASTPVYFDNPSDWNKWQLEYLESLIKEDIQQGKASPLLEERDVRATTGGRLQPEKELSEGSLVMYADKLCFTDPRDRSLTFDISKIYGENVQYNDLLEFYHEKTLYRFGRKISGMSAYKWVKGLETLRRIKPE